MGERRKWDKQPHQGGMNFPTNPAAAAANSSNSNSGNGGAIDPVREKQVQYLKMLEERNRLKKKLALTTKKEQHDKQREDTFTTTFNVATGVTTTAMSSGAAHQHDTTVRKNKSSAALLSTRMGTASGSTSGDARGRSAPSTTLPLRYTPRGNEGDDNGDADAKRLANQPAAAAGVRRAKWNKPAAGASFGVESRNGKSRLCVEAKEQDAKPVVLSEEEEDEEDEYLEESFEEFEAAGSAGSEDEQDDDEDVEEKIDGRPVELSNEKPTKIAAAVPRRDEKKQAVEEPVLSEMHPSIHKAESKQSSAAVMSDASSSSGLSRTTSELFSVVQNLSRSKQKALVEVLQKFTSSDQSAKDRQLLQSSISDPAIWKQISEALKAGDTSATKVSSVVTEEKKPAGLTMAEVMEEQQKWEEQYAKQVQERLAKERQEKEKAFQDAEARRAAMLKQLDDEEKELEALMEKKRQQRIAKLRALAEQEDESDAAEPRSSDELAMPTPAVGKSPRTAKHKTHAPSKSSSPKKKSKAPRVEESGSHQGHVVAATAAEEKAHHHHHHHHHHSPKPVVPALNFGSVVVPDDPSSQQQPANGSSIELRIRLLSTWGNTRAIGLTQICVYDIHGTELPVDTSRVQVYERTDGRPLPKSHEMMRTMPRLFSGIAQTTNDQEMWLGRLSNSGILEIAFEVSAAPSKLCIWNYNSKMCSACARDVEIFVSGKCVWNGSLPQGYGDEDDNVCMWINVLPSGKKTVRASVNNTGSVRSSTTATHVMDSTTIAMNTSSSASSLASGGPIWLATSSSSTTTLNPTTSKPCFLKADAKAAETLVDFETKTPRTTATTATTTTGSFTSRRQRTDTDDDHTGSLSSARMSSGKDSVRYAADENMQMSEAKSRRRGDEEDGDYGDKHGGGGASKATERKQALVGSANAVGSPSWDSLEHFSKTSRSRLPSATTDEAASRVDLAPPRVAPKHVPIATSALLTELRGGGGGSSMTSLLPQMPPTVPPTTAVKIPELPSGRRLKLEILSTWGDQYYVGLNGIELFDQRGKLIPFGDAVRQVIARPPSINVLDEYEDDPRVAANLVDGVNGTCDDFHMWLAPYTLGERHEVSLDMGKTTSLSMVRVWNYNKSRAHTFRGVRQIRLVLFENAAGKNGDDDGDAEGRGRVIFEGEIERAPGALCREAFDCASGGASGSLAGDGAMWCEVILFTNDHTILQQIEANDTLLKAYGREEADEQATSAIAVNVRTSMESRRPRTSDKGRQPDSDTDMDTSANNITTTTTAHCEFKDKRPTTSAKRQPPPSNSELRKSVDSWMTTSNEPQQKSPVLSKLAETDEEEEEEDEEEEDNAGLLLRGRRLTIRLLTTWGDPNYIGLTQLDVLVGNHGTPLPLDLSNLDATPRDLATLGYDGDPRTLDKLVNGVGTTCDDANMWLIPFGNSRTVGTHEIRIDLKRDQFLHGLRVWNYNKSHEDSFRGAKQITVSLDGKLISPRQTGFILRKAPGNALFDFDQIVRFSSSGQSATGSDPRERLYVDKVLYPLSHSQLQTYKTPLVKQDYEPALFPQGFMLKFVFWTTWGDPYYLGLNGIELYDFQGEQIMTKPSIVAAKPYSLSDIDDTPNDVRVPENLLNGNNKNTWDASDAWLCPLASSLGSSGSGSDGNLLYLAFDTPIVLSLIKFWNYSKTPERGVKDMDIYLDDLQIFSGSLRKAPHGNISAQVIVGGGRSAGTKQLVTDEFGQPVLFTTHQNQVDYEKRKIFYCGAEEQDVLCINEGQVVQESKAMYRKPDPGAEGVVVDLGLRPMTAMNSSSSNSYHNRK